MQRPENLLLVFFGMIATGKSYLASFWARQFAVPYYNSDRERKKLAGLTPETSQQEEVDRGIYRPEFSRRTYDALLTKAKKHFLHDPKTCVVLDGSYQSQKERDLLRHELASYARIVFVHCDCSEQVVKERLRIREKDSAAVSDGTWEIYLSQKERFQRPAAEESIVYIDTDAPVEDLVEEVNGMLFDI